MATTSLSPDTVDANSTYFLGDFARPDDAFDARLSLEPLNELLEGDDLIESESGG